MRYGLFGHKTAVAEKPSQDSITGLLLAGIGHVNEQQRKNFLVVDSSMTLVRVYSSANHESGLETQVSTIESAFQEFTTRKDIAILLINQHVCHCSCR